MFKLHDLTHNLISLKKFLTLLKNYKIKNKKLFNNLRNFLIKCVKFGFTIQLLMNTLIFVNIFQIN